jgi:hypothetical protein
MADLNILSVSLAFLLFSGTFCAKPARIEPQKCRVTNFFCTHDPALVKDVVCNFKSSRRIFGIFNIGATLLYPSDNVWVKTFENNSGGQFSVKTPTPVHPKFKVGKPLQIWFIFSLQDVLERKKN